MYLIIGPRASKCENKVKEIMAGESYMQVSNLTFDPCFKVKWGHHTKEALYLPYRVSKCENSLLEIMSCESFANVPSILKWTTSPFLLVL